LLVGVVLFAEFAHEKIFFGTDTRNDWHELRRR
jgi:hypothetical protein